MLAESPTRSGIVDAFNRRHSYGAQDNILLVVKFGDHLMGHEFTFRTAPQLEITAIRTAPISRVAIVRGVGNEVPTYVYNATPPGAEISLKSNSNFNLKWTDSNPVPGQTCYCYVRIEQSDGKLAWASPMWIKYEGK